MSLCWVVVYFPYAMADAWIFEHSEWQAKPFVLVQAGQSLHRQSVLGVSSQASFIYPGQLWGKLQKRFPQVEALNWEAGLLAKWRQALLEKSLLLVPEAYWRRNALLLNLSGTQRLYNHNLQNWWGEFKQVLGSGEIPVSSWRLAIAGRPLVAELVARAGWWGNWVRVPVEQEDDYIRDVPLRWLPGVGKQRLHKMEQFNLQTLGDLFRVGNGFRKRHFPGLENELQQMFRENYVQKRVAVKGENSFKVEVSLETSAKEAVWAKGRQLADEMGFRLRQMGHRAGRRWKLELIYADGVRRDCTWTTPVYTNEFATLASEVRSHLAAIFNRRVALKTLSLRALGLRNADQQTDLFAVAEQENYYSLEQALDKIRTKNSFADIRTGDMFL